MTNRCSCAVVALLSLGALDSYGAPSKEVICTYAPSQSNAVATVAGAAGGTSATIGAVASAMGLTAVAHSSGAMILTGSSGYIAGTIGTTAATFAAAPVVVVVGLVVGGTVASLELVCASQNHPDQVAKVRAASSEFASRFASAWQSASGSASQAASNAAPAIRGVQVKAKTVLSDVWQYVYRVSAQ